MKFRSAFAIATLVLASSSLTIAVAGQAPAGPPQPTPAIAGVVNAGTQVTLVKDGFEAVEGPVRDTDGGVLFTNNQTGQVVRVAPDGTISNWFEGPYGANALTRTGKGEIVATLQKTNAIAVLSPGAEPRVLFDKFEGKPFNRPNDLVADKRGNIYFTDSVPVGATGTPLLPSSVYRITADNKLVLVTSDVPRPNGVALSPDERTLYVANTAGEYVLAYALDAKGTPGAKRDFAKLALPPAPAGGAAPGAAAPAAASTASGADGLAVDADGRLFVATTVGVQVFSPQGQPLGVIALPRQPQNLAFAGADRSVLFVVGRGSVYRIPTLTRGPDRPGK
jgi:gluconolactonase